MVTAPTLISPVVVASPICNVPVFTVVVPVYRLMPVSTWVPAPDLATMVGCDAAPAAKAPG